MWSQLFLFSESCFLATNICEKKIRKKFGVWGGEGRGIDKTGYNVLPFLNMLNVSLHCFD